MTERARILIVNTGGTVGMKSTPDGLQPEAGHLERLLSEIPRLLAPELPAFEVVEISPLLDSADMTPEEWLRIAEVIDRAHDDHDGFLVIHGTDTMAFTASALSFMLEGLARPVILTGSQVPLAAARNDALNNIVTSLAVLGRHHQRLSEVFICFAGLLLRGNRATKVDTRGFSAFESPNLPPVGELGIDLELNWRLVRPPSGEPRGIVAIGKATVGAFRIFPGIRAGYLTNLLSPPVQGVVLECYGAGNAPSRNRELMAALADATARGVVIVAVTQVRRGSARLDLYKTGRALLDAGVVSGMDMTPEAALAKLYYLFDRGHPPREVRELMQQDLRGELGPGRSERR